MRMGALTRHGTPRRRGRFVWRKGKWSSVVVVCRTWREARRLAGDAPRVSGSRPRGSGRPRLPRYVDAPRPARPVRHVVFP